MRLRFGIAIAWTWTLLSAAGTAQAQPVRVPVSVSVPTKDGAAVVDAAWINSQVAEANRVFAPADVEFVVTETRTRSHTAEANTRDERDALGPDVKRGVVNWFVVKKLMDIDEAGRERRGVHWRANRSVPPSANPSDRVHLVIVSAIAGASVLAHELGHFFGNHPHSTVAGNIMSYDRGPNPPAFDEAQLQRVRRALRAMLRSRELLPAPAPTN